MSKMHISVYAPGIVTFYDKKLINKKTLFSVTSVPLW